MGALVQLGATEQLNVKTVYYAGTDKLPNGAALCYDVAASASAADVKTRLGNQVVKPATANLMFFAGVLAPQSWGLTGPCYVDIIPHQKNGFVANAYTNLNQTGFSTTMGPVNASYALGAAADATFNVNFVGIAGSTVDTSGTAALAPIVFK